MALTGRQSREALPWYAGLGGIDVDSKRRVREDVWAALRKAAKPDSTYHFDFGESIPDFEGSTAALAKLLALRVYEGSEFIFITPDNCLEELRARTLRDGKSILVPTYGIRRVLSKWSPAMYRREARSTPPGWTAWSTLENTCPSPRFSNWASSIS
jgi:hypothetical protein